MEWSELQYIPVMSLEDSVLNCWAPGITYDMRSKKHFICRATTIEDQFEAGSISGDGRYKTWYGF